ncbi:MAG: hypothetical protein JWQ97_19 [Phenylobacterium sp.]|nr:hypothetical protein [Phenylobacterium sp.]
MLSAVLALMLAASGAARAHRAPAQAAPKQAAPAPAPAFDPHTRIVEGPALQVVFGERALFHLDDKGAPVLDEVQKGPLAVAHPAGAVQESFAAPKPGQLAAALDGSAEKSASYLKIWNGLDHAVAYRAGILAYSADGGLHPATVKVCAVPADGTNYQTWPVPVVAVALASFTPAPDDKSCN